MDATEQINESRDEYTFNLQEIDATEPMNEEDGFNVILDNFAPADKEQLNDSYIDLYEEDELAAIQEDVNDPDGFVPINDHWLSNEDYNKIFKQRHPTSSQWKDSAGPEANNVLATINGGRKIMWQQAKTEINFIRQKVKAALGEKEPTIKNLWDLIFGPKSKIGRLLEEKLLMKIEDLDKVLGTYCLLAAAYNLSKTKLFDKNS
jgi:hypothetical protein